MKKNGMLGFLRQKGKLAALVVLGTLGLLLLLLSSLGASSTKSTESAETDPVLDAEALSVYQAKLEKELEHFCEAAAGVSDVHVMLTITEGYRREYLTDGEGEPVTIGSGSAAHALARTLKPPAIGGVGIICRRGNDPAVQRTLVELISTTLGIPSNRVFVTGT